MHPQQQRLAGLGVLGAFGRQIHRQVVDAHQAEAVLGAPHLLSMALVFAGDADALTLCADAMVLVTSHQKPTACMPILWSKEQRNQARYPGQRILVVRLNGTVHLVPYSESDNHVFMKTIITSRRAHRQYTAAPTETENDA